MGPGELSALDAEFFFYMASSILGVAFDAFAHVIGDTDAVSGGGRAQLPSYRKV